MILERFCQVCGEKIPVKRVQLGYTKTCVKHSTQEKYTGLVTATGKTDYEVIVMKDPEIAKRLVAMSNTYGKKKQFIEYE